MRSYATEPPNPRSRRWLYVGGGFVAFSAIAFYVSPGPKQRAILRAKAEEARAKVEGKAEDTRPKKPFFLGGEQGFVDLKLASVEDVNHNTKRF